MNTEPARSSELAGRVAIVTGGASGIGQAIARRLAARGATIAIVDRNAEAAGAAAMELGGASFVADLTKAEETRGVVERVAMGLGAPTILVNDAGFQHVAPIDAFPEDRWRAMLELMLTAPFLLTQAAWPHMVAANWGRIVNVASIHGVVASSFKVAYVAAKHGLVGLTRTAALEGGPFGITVNAVCPAFVRTPLVDEQIRGQARAHRISEDEVISQIMLEPSPIKRLIEPAEVAEMVAYLCSSGAAMVNGATMMLDAGWTTH